MSGHVSTRRLDRRAIGSVYGRFFGLLAAALAVGCVELGEPAEPFEPVEHRQAVSNVGSFEIDGDSDDDSGPGEPLDWNSPPPNRTLFTDAPTPQIPKQQDDSFGGGSKETEPGGWTCSTGSVPAKDDILRGGIAFREVGGVQHAYVHWVRDSVNGTAHIDYELNLSTETISPTCNIPKRTNGDLLIAYDAVNGGSTVKITLYRWNGNASTGTFQKIDPPPGSFAGAVNIPPNSSDPGLAPGAFGEAAINLEAAFGRKLACGEFTTATMKSRASDSISAQLKDRTAPRSIDLGNCPASSLDKGVRNVSRGEQAFANETDASTGDTVEYQLVYTNGGSGSANDVVITEEVPELTTFKSCSDNCVVQGTTVTWSLGTVAGGATKAVTMQVEVERGLQDLPRTTDNVAIVDTREEEPRPSDEVTVTVVGPDSFLAKSARNVTAGQQDYATNVSAKPGDTVEYRLIYTNGGQGTGHGVVVEDEVPGLPHTKWLSCDPSCGDTADGVMTWQLGDVEAGGSRTMTFRVEILMNLTADKVIENVAHARTEEEREPEPSNKVIVNVDVTPGLEIDKEARDEGPFEPGELIVYDLKVSNTGDAVLTNVTVEDTLPADTEFESCSDNCTHSGNTVTWSLGSMAPGAERTVTLTVTNRAEEGCEICNTAVARAAGGVTDSDTECVGATPVDDPSSAFAEGESAIFLLKEPFLHDIDHRESAQFGPGFDRDPADETQPAPLVIPAEAEGHLLGLGDQRGDIAWAEVAYSLARSEVNNEAAIQRSQAGLVNLNLLDPDGIDGTLLGNLPAPIQIGLIRSHASAEASGTSSSYSDAGTMIQGVFIDEDGALGLGEPKEIDLDELTEPGQSLKIELDSGQFGVDSFIEFHFMQSDGDAFHEGGRWKAKLLVSAIHLQVSDSDPLTSGEQPVDLYINMARAHAEYPGRPLCRPQHVSGHAFLARADVQTPVGLQRYTEGFVDIPSHGGYEEQTLHNVSIDAGVPDHGVLLTAQTANSKSEGALIFPDENGEGGSSASKSSAIVEDASCILRLAGVDRCALRASVIGSEAESSADTNGAGSTGRSFFVGLEIGGEPQEPEPQPNTLADVDLDGDDLPDLVIVFNEQVCDGGSTAVAGGGTVGTCGGAADGSSGITVRALRITVLNGTLFEQTLDLGVEIIVAESHADSRFQ